MGLTVAFLTSALAAAAEARERTVGTQCHYLALNPAGSNLIRPNHPNLRLGSIPRHSYALWPHSLRAGAPGNRKTTRRR